jgi:hypothetical protein
MNWFPQLASGAMAQYPLHRNRQWRAIANTLESGEAITLRDTPGGWIEWRLRYEELTDAEVAKLTGFFQTSRGEAGSFGFVDPFANLLGWSEDLSKPDWQKGLLSVSGGLSDPSGRQRAWSAQNGSGAEQSLAQTLAIPGEYRACFSAYVRSDSAGVVGIARDSSRVNVPVGPQWKRIQISGAAAAGATESTFSIVLAAGSTVRVFGLQVEAQPWPSIYRSTGVAAGILEDTRFKGGELKVVHTAPGLSACQVNLISRV